MTIRSSSYSFFLTICLGLMSLLFLPMLALADTIKLKDGSVFKGKVTSYNQRKFTIVIYIGSSASQHIIPVEEIESVEFDAADTGAPKTLNPAANPETVGAKADKPRYEAMPNQQPIVRPVEPSSTPEPTALPAPSNAGNTETAPAGVGETAGLLADKTVSVAAAADWTSTEVRVQRGQKVIITASGEVDLGNNQRATPNGITLNDGRKLMLTRPTGGLIAVVGDDNDEFVYVGANGEFTATHNGVLFLSVNEGNLKDNNGSFIAKIKVFNK